MSVIINKVFNANIYADGGSLFGKADEVVLPSIKTKDGDNHEPLGFIGSVPYASGFDALSGCKITWNSTYADTIKKFGNIYQAIKLQVRFSQESYEGGNRISQQPGIAYLTVRPMDLATGTFGAKTAFKPETNLTCTYIKMQIAGEELYELDFEANIYKVGGVDLMATYRANLGI